MLIRGLQQWLHLLAEAGMGEGALIPTLFRPSYILYLQHTHLTSASQPFYILHLTSATHPTYNLHLLSAPQSSYILYLTSATHPCYILHLISATRHLSYILGTLKVLIIYMLSCHQPVSNRCTMAIELHKLPHSAAHLTSYYILQHILYCAL